MMWGSKHFKWKSRLSKRGNVAITCLGGGFNYIYTPILGEMIPSDEHIFQMGGSTTCYIWLVVSNIFYFHPYWGDDPIWRAYFSNGWEKTTNQKLVVGVKTFFVVFFHFLHEAFIEQKNTFWHMIRVPPRRKSWWSRVREQNQHPGGTSWLIATGSGRSPSYK